MPQNQVSSAD